MNTGSRILQPPNRQLLSDDVIGGFSLHAKPIKRKLGTSEDACMQDGSDPTLPPRHLWKTEPVNTVDYASVHVAQKRKSSPFEHAQIVDQILGEQTRLRELRRIRQIRYRKKKDDYANSIEKETHHLQNEINKLEKRRRSVSSAVPAKENVWSVATEYFRLFRYGLKTTGATESSAQQDLLRKYMASDTVFSAGRGPDAMMMSWKRMSMWFEDVELELEGLSKTGKDSIVAETTTRVTVTERTLQGVFPYLSRSEKGRALGDKLLNQRLVMRGSMRFQWDPVCCRIVRVMSQSDLLRLILHE
ncbi:hypothetical protein PInf_008038 [Phytophthora infestans]|nr:hypothetical protein PInf_008038 [Phytophthora infestans]